MGFIIAISVLLCSVAWSELWGGWRGGWWQTIIWQFGIFSYFCIRIMEQMNNIQEILNRCDRFAAGAGCKVTEVDERHAVAEMTVGEEHLNAGGVCQGGALFTLADLALAALMNHQGNLTFGIGSHVMFLSSAAEGDRLRAEAVSIADHHKLPTIEVRVTNQEGKLICHLTGMGYRKEVTLAGKAV